MPLDRDNGPTVLIVDDEELGRFRMETLLGTLARESNFRTVSCSNLTEAMHILHTTPVHIVILDKNLESGKQSRTENGIAAIPDMLAVQPHLQIFIVSGSSDSADALQAMRKGAANYIKKCEPDELIRILIKRAVDTAMLLRHSAMSGFNRPEEAAPRFTAKSRYRRLIADRIPAAAESSFPVLVTGNAGTGKTTLARVIHNYRRAYLKQPERPFVSVQIGAATKVGLEAELFGVEPSDEKSSPVLQGALQLANTGTLLLEGVDRLPRKIQKKLLAYLNDGKFQRIGGSKTYQSSFKLICSSETNLEQLTTSDAFDQSLFEKLSTFSFRLPDLVDAKADIPVLAREMLAELAREAGVQSENENIPDDLVLQLSQLPPSGNLHGLREALRQIALTVTRRGNRLDLRDWRSPSASTDQGFRSIAGRTITLRDVETLPFDMAGANFPGLSHALKIAEKKILEDASRKFYRNKDIAGALGISEGLASIKLKKFRIRVQTKNTFAERANSSNIERN